MTTNQFNENEEDKPLDPVLEKVRRKMIRLLAVSIGIMVVALIGVMIAIVYKTKEVSTEATPQAQNLSVPSDAPLNVAVNLPTGFTVTSTSLSGNRILFFGTETNGQQKAYIFDLTTSRMISDIKVNGQ